MNALALDLSPSLDWGELAPLRLKARAVAEGIYAGTHRSARRGAGVEFGGHRNYVPGDDLRWLDRRATMRHDRPLIRLFETETDRVVCLLLDATLSMRYRSADAPGAKLAYAAVLAAALARISLAAGDPVSLDWIGGDGCQPLPTMGGKEAFERVLAMLEGARASGNHSSDTAALDRALARLARRARRGAVIIFLSDLVDQPNEAKERFAALSTSGRTLVVVRILDPVERNFPFEGPVRLRSSEGNALVETDAATARARYLRALEEQAIGWGESVVERGGRLVDSTTTDNPVDVIRSILRAVEGGRR